MNLSWDCRFLLNISSTRCHRDTMYERRPAVNQRSHRDTIYSVSPCYYQGRMTDKATGRDSDKFMLRLPDGMRDRLSEEARANKRSINAEIISRIEESFSLSSSFGKDDIFPRLEQAMSKLEEDLKRNDATTRKIIDYYNDQLTMSATLFKIILEEGKLNKSLRNIIESMLNTYRERYSISDIPHLSEHLGQNDDDR